MFALIQQGTVWQLFDEDPHLAMGLDVRNVSKISGIAVGWEVKPDGSITAPTPAPTPIPSVSSAQAKIQLRRAKLRDKVDDLISKAHGEVQDWFTDARTWQRDNPHVVAIGANLELSPAEIDDLFRAAALIDA